MFFRTNKAGKDFSDILSPRLSDGESVRFSHSTQNVEIEFKTSSEAKKFYEAIQGVLEGKVSHFDVLSLLNMLVTGTESVLKNYHEKKYDAQAEYALALEQAVAEERKRQEAAEAEKRKMTLIAVGGVAVVLLVALSIMFKD